MNILVVLKMVPDVVEELELAEGGASLDPDALRMIPSESDEHALEQALLLKERGGGHLTVAALDAPEVDDALFTALAKGADRAVKLAGAHDGLDIGGATAAIADWLPTLDPRPDLVVTGTQAIDDLRGLAAPWLAHLLGRPYVGIVTAVAPANGGAHLTVLKEFPGGVRGEIRVALPAVLGIQAAEKPPRYVPVAKVRAVAKSQRIEVVTSDAAPPPTFVQIVAMAKPVAAGHAEMIPGDPDAVAGRLFEILAARGLA
jgi:electron transfer flavoprotein beta subunit